MNQDLPIGWVRVCISDIGEVVTGNTPPTNQKERFYGGEIPFVKPPDLDAGEFLDFASETLTHQGSLQARLLPPSSILVNCIGNVGKVAFSRVACCTNQQINSIVPDTRLVEPKFVYWSIRAPIFQDLLKSNTSATTVSIINKGRFSKLEISLPPLNEQRRIVEKLDRIFDRLRRVRDELSHIKKLIDRYRQSVLTAACSGELTEDWRIKQNLQDSWQSVNLGEVLIDKPKNGYSAKPVQYETPFRVLTLTATTSGKFNPEHFKYFDEPIEINSEFWLQPNDILIQRGNTIEYVGVPAIYDGLPNQFIFPDLMIRLRTKETVITKFLYFVLSCEKSRQYLRYRATGTAGSMPKINQSTLISLPIHLPSLEEQKEIVRRIEERFAKIDKLEQEYQKAVKLCDRLEQETLAKAFRGELVPQDPNDEPASVLLERIRAEQQAKTKAKTAKSKKRSGKK